MIKLLMLFIIRSFKTPKLTKYLIPLILMGTQISAESFHNLTRKSSISNLTLAEPYCSPESLSRLDINLLIDSASNVGWTFSQGYYDAAFQQCERTNEWLGAESIAGKVLNDKESCANFEFRQMVRSNQGIDFIQHGDEVLLTNVGGRRIISEIKTNQSFAGTVVENTYKTRIELEQQGQFRITDFPLDQKITSVTSASPVTVICQRYYSNSELEQKRLEEQERASASQERERQRLEENAKEAYREKIFRNCIADKLSNTSNQQFVRAVQEICIEISQSPNFWQRFWYDTMGG